MHFTTIVLILLLVIRVSHTATSLYGINYSPRRSLSSCPTSEMIESDLRLLRNITARIKTFSLIDTGSGRASAHCRFSEDILTAAGPLGFKVALGMEFRGGDIDKMFESELSELKRLIETYRRSFESVEAIVVGSETLYRGEETQQTLSQRITTVRSLVQSSNLNHINITAAESTLPFYGDILISAVDYIMVNLYPYWEGRNVSSAATDQLAAIRSLQSHTSKKILLGECGWASTGNANGVAEPSLSNLEVYFKRWVCVADRNGIGYYLFEAFDEEWKSDEHGGVEKHWGLFDANRKIKSSVFLNVVDCS